MGSTHYSVLDILTVNPVMDLAQGRREPTHLCVANPPSLPLLEQAKVHIHSTPHGSHHQVVTERDKEK